MSVSYTSVGWNRAKKAYDATIAAGLVVYLALFVGVGLAAHPDATIETILIRALATAAFLMLHVILSIGPLCRLDPKFLPLLYNRRHLGVTMFLVALAHAVFAIVQFHALGNVNPLVSLLTAGTGFQTFGLAALLILFLMAATSHDFWLANLSPRVWKTLHMGVYFAYALIVLHVALGRAPRRGASGARDRDRGSGWRGSSRCTSSPRFASGRGIGTPRASRTAGSTPGPSTTFPRAARASSARESGSRSFATTARSRRSRTSAATRTVRSGEGRVIDGCITCPWHGYQYLPANGRSPAPFTEKVADLRRARRRRTRLRQSRSRTRRAPPWSLPMSDDVLRRLSRRRRPKRRAA